MNPQKKLKLILASLKDRQIIKFFEAFIVNFQDQFKKTIRQISFNCYESVCEFKNKVVSGYGKNSQQSYVNSVRTLVELLADDSKLHSIMRQCLRIVQQISANNCQSQKKLVNFQRQSLNNEKIMGMNGSIRPTQKKTTLKQEIFQYLNLDNVKISNPNATHKTKLHDKYLNQSSTNNDDDSLTLQEVLKRNRELEQRILQSRQENAQLKLQLQQQLQSRQNQNSQNSYINIKENDPIYKQNRKQNEESKLILMKDKMSSSNLNLKSRQKERQTFDPLKTRNDYLNMSQDTKLMQKSKLRSVSVEASQTQKYMMPKSSAMNCNNDKKILVPKLNLQVLPNYHGKSNKSLNQSLMEVYQKTHAK